MCSQQCMPAWLLQGDCVGLVHSAPWALTGGVQSLSTDTTRQLAALVGLPPTDCSPLSACSSSSTAPKVQQLALGELSLVSCSQLHSCCIGLMPAPRRGAGGVPPGEATSFVEVETSVERKPRMPGYSWKRCLGTVLLSTLHVSILSHHF